jgi:tetratricopeptide (TPR) repeat protein
MTVPAETIRSARELLTQGKTEDMLSLLRDHLQSHQAELSSDAERTRLAASLLEELNQTVAAEEMYQAYVSLADLPDARLALVAFLARQRRPQEALDLCERLWTELPPQEIAPVSVTVLRTAGVGQEDCQRVERWLDAAIQKNSTDAALLLCLADLRDFQARFDDAAMIYRTIINRDNRNVIALNNLAFLLAHKDGGAAEALSLINRAIGIAGPAPELLDTRASVFLALGDVNKAVEDLHQAIDRTGINTAAMASQQFHLARAYHMARRTGDAQVAFRQARDSAGTVPHPLERRTYEGLTKELALDKSN